MHYRYNLVLAAFDYLDRASKLQHAKA
uniref:Uncharacterized protein n=1 Tax=Ralstonia solanacearum TaxID=305 RepID=A0A0S4WLD9_RALSL|nr:protein of unknown function [Ralstonia solanacearum]CUV47528.1 protein of unknown function [Ralstonia solanacearum]